MKRVGTVLLAAMLFVSVPVVRGEEKGDKGTDELKTLDAKLTDAFKTHDLKTLEKYAADDMIVIDPLGRVHTKKSYFENMGKGNVKIDDLKETDIKVRVYGDTGVVTGMLTLKAMVKDKDISGDYRWTRVYNKKGGNWMVVAEQHTYVTPVEEKKEKGEKEK